MRYALRQPDIDPDSLVVSTANKVQGREYEVVLVWHPLAGRRDATAFHLEAGRMCVMLSRHRQVCIVAGRAGADRLLAEFPDADPIFLDEPEKFPDGWEANSLVLTSPASDSNSDRLHAIKCDVTVVVTRSSCHPRVQIGVDVRDVGVRQRLLQQDWPDPLRSVHVICPPSLGPALAAPTTVIVELRQRGSVT